MFLIIEVPDAVVNAMQLPREEVEQELRKELAVALYARGELSLGKSVEMAKISRQEFEAVLAHRRIERPFSAEELQRDLDFASR